MHEPTPLSDEALLARLVGFDSTSHNSNRPIADFIRDYLDGSGAIVEEQPAPEEDKLNLIIRLGPETTPGDRSGLVLSGHMDVVPALEPEWTSDPFELTEGDDRWIGRGSCDMKGFVALALNAIWRARSRSLTHPLALVLTYDEEIGTVGAHHFARHWETRESLPRRTIVGEPTSLDVVRLHKGHCKMRLTVHGRSAHSGYPHLGHNSIEPMGRLLTALGALRLALEAERSHHSEHFPEVPFVALNLARLRAGTAINIIPDQCVLELGFRVLPGIATADVRQRVEVAIREALEGEDYTLEELNRSPPLLLAEDHDLYRHLCSIMDQDQTVSASYATDGGWLQNSGFDCLLWGPGTIEVAHRPNEWMPKDEYRRASGLLDRTVSHFCHGQQ